MSRKHLRMAITQCMSDECGFRAIDSSKCLLVANHHRCSDKYFLAGGPCLWASNPMFAATKEFEAMSDEKKLAVIPETISEEKASQRKVRQVSRRSFTAHGTLGPSRVPGQESDDAAAMSWFATAFESMSAIGRIAAMAWAQAYMENSNDD